MSDPRLATHIEATALIRRAETSGGTGIVLRKGDRDAGALLVILAQRGMVKGVTERALMPGGNYRWRFLSLDEIEKKQHLNDFISMRGRIDPDLWMLELDIPEAERFAAQLIREG